MEPYWLPPGEGAVLPRIGTLKASASRTGDSFELIEYSGPAAPPPHVHRMREEAFYILDGSFHFVLGEDAFHAAAGSFIFVPRGTRHGFTVEPGGRALLLVTPSGLEGFFAELGEGLEAGRSGAEIRQALAGRYDSTPV
jgi:quercetin dioxygenase-like cupin family protein